MYLAGYLFVIVIGALMRWAVTYEAPDFDIQAAGLIIMIVAIVGLVISLTLWFYRRGWTAPWHGPRQAGGAPSQPVNERVVREYVPPPRDDEERASSGTAIRGPSPNPSEKDTQTNTADDPPNRPGGSVW